MERAEGCVKCDNKKTTVKNVSVAGSGLLKIFDSNIITLLQSLVTTVDTLNFIKIEVIPLLLSLIYVLVKKAPWRFLL